MQLKKLLQEYDLCERYQETERLYKFFSDTIKYIIENEWFFLLEVTYPFEMDNPVDIKAGNLVIKKEPLDGFLLMKSVPIINILNNDFENLEIEESDVMLYLKTILALIPIIFD